MLLAFSTTLQQTRFIENYNFTRAAALTMASLVAGCIPAVAGFLTFHQIENTTTKHIVSQFFSLLVLHRLTVLDRPAGAVLNRHTLSVHVINQLAMAWHRRYLGWRIEICRVARMTGRLFAAGFFAAAAGFLTVLYAVAIIFGAADVFAGILIASLSAFWPELAHGGITMRLKATVILFAAFANSEELLTGACRAAATRSTKRLGDCINLVPPSTGTRSLESMLSLYSAYAHHDHRITVDMVQGADFLRDAEGAKPSSWLSRFEGKALATPTCFVVTLRDPAARVRSSINNCRKGQNCFKKNPHWCVEFPAYNWTADAIVAAFFDDADPGHATVNGRSCWGLDISTTRRYLAGATLSPPRPPRRRPPFLRAGLNCSSSEIHYLCTDRLVDDFAALVARLGDDATKLEELEASDVDLHMTGNRHHDSPRRRRRRRLAGEAYGDRVVQYYQSDLSDAAKARVRSELFPGDTALYEAYCGKIT